MLRLFVDNLLPVFLAAGAGFLLAARLHVDPRPISRVAFLVLAPCFVFDTIVSSAVPAGALLRMVGQTLTVLVGLAVVAGLIARAMGWSRPTSAAVVLTVLLPNAGNLGLPVNRFALGESGLAHASIFFVTASVVTFTLGVLVASAGRSSLGASLGRLLRMPALWAVLAAVGSLATGLSLPTPIERTVDLFAGATIPTFLLVLGIQLHGAGLRGPRGPVVLAAVLRLCGGALFGLLAAELYGLEGVARQAGVLQSAMPSAVIGIVLATEYDTEPALVTAVVVLTTLVSPLTLTPLMAWLGV